MRVTKHGQERMRERLGLPKRALVRKAALALERGRPREAFGGPLRDYLNYKHASHGNADNMRVYGHELFIFNGEDLITAWALPRKYWKDARHGAENLKV